jgi:hypothetical protein
MTIFSSSLRTNDVTLWRYKKVSTKEDPGWAIIVVGSDGYFSACSDYGNYAFIWGSPGVADFREFLVGAQKDPHYFVGKLSHGQKYDGDATVRMYKEEILRMRGELAMSKEDAREEWDRLDNSDLDNVIGFKEWMDETKLEFAWEWGYQESHSPQVHAFVERIMGDWLAPILKAELEKAA